MSEAAIAIQWTAASKQVTVQEYIASLKPYTPPYHLKPYNKPLIAATHKYNA